MFHAGNIVIKYRFVSKKPPCKIGKYVFRIQKNNFLRKCECSILTQRSLRRVPHITTGECSRIREKLPRSGKWGKSEWKLLHSSSGKKLINILAIQANGLESMTREALNKTPQKSVHWGAFFYVQFSSISSKDTLISNPTKIKEIKIITNSQ